MNHRLALLAVVTTLTLGFCAPATEPAPAPGPITYTPPAWPEPPSAGPLLLRLTLATAAVFAIGGIAIFLVRRLGPRTPVGKADSRLRLVDTLPLGNGSSLYMVECCGRRFVAGVSPTGFRSLAPLPEPFENELDVLASLT